MSASTARSAKLAVPARALGDPLGNALERGDEAQERYQRPEQPHGQIEGARREYNGRAAGKFEDRAGFAALGRREARDFRYVARALGKLQSVERRSRSHACLHASNIADEPREASRIFDSHGLAQRVI